MRSGNRIMVRTPNNSFKPSPLRGLGRASQDCHSAVAAQRPGLTQALGRRSQTFKLKSFSRISGVSDQAANGRALPGAPA